MKLKEINVNCHSSILLEVDNMYIYVDPYKIVDDSKKADYIFITHTHYDHLSIDDLKKIIKDDTKFVIPINEIDKLNELNINNNNILGVLPNKSYTFTSISFNTIPSYNTNKEFHKKEYNWVGYLFNNFDSSLYIAGDTDNNEDIRKINCDIAMIPIGGKFTMDYKEAADYVNTIKPKKVIPIHYGTIVGSNLDANKFKELVDSDIEVIIPFL